MQDGAIASESCSQVDFLSQGTVVFESMNREGERVVKSGSCMWFDDNFNIGIGVMDVAMGIMLEEAAESGKIAPPCELQERRRC